MIQIKMRTIEFRCVGLLLLTQLCTLMEHTYTYLAVVELTGSQNELWVTYSEYGVHKARKKRNQYKSFRYN